PDGRAERRVLVIRIPSPGIRNDHVEAIVLTQHTIEQRDDLLVDCVVDANADPAPAARGYLVRDVVDGRPAGDVDGRSGLAEREGDALPDAARRAGNDRNGAVERRRRPAHLRDGVFDASKAARSSSGIVYVCCSSGNTPVRTSSA